MEIIVNNPGGQVVYSKGCTEYGFERRGRDLIF